MSRLLLLLFLTSCAPEIVNKPYPVETPVAVRCHAPAVAKPDFAVDGVRPTDSDAAKVQALLVTNEQRKSYEVKLEANNRSCR